MSEKIEKSFKSEAVDRETKLKIMLEYKEKTGKEIKASTVYKGYNIGIWKTNLRNKDLHGKLNMSKELRKKFTEAGILGDRKRAKRTSDLDKFNMFIKFHKKNPDVEIQTDTVDQEGNPIGEYKHWLQAKVNNGTTELSEEQINVLKDLRFVNYSKNEIKQICEQYDIYSALAKEILKKYSSVQDFIKAYKNGETESKNHYLNKRGIIISKNNLSMKQKQSYLKLIEDIYGENILNDLSKFISEEELKEAIENLSPNERFVIKERYKKAYLKCQVYGKIGPKLGVTGERAKQINNDALNNLSKILKVHQIEEEIILRDTLLKELDDSEKITFEEWQKKKLEYDVETLGLTKLTIEKLKNNGYNIISDLIGITKEELLNIKGFGNKVVEHILRGVNNAISTLTKEKQEIELRDLKEKYRTSKQNVEGFSKAIEYYLNEEDIFNLDETIPPSVDTNETKLTRKKNEKKDKQSIFKKLEEEINLQNDKSEKIASILEENEIIKKTDEISY